MVEIRHCRIDDFESVLPLLQQLWPQKKLQVDELRKVYARGIESPLQEYLCALEESRLVGFCSLVIKNNLWQEGNLGHIDELVVDDQYRGKGIGSQLLDQIIRLAKDRGCRRVELDTAFHRKEAHEFYGKKGFENRAYLFSKVL